MTSDLFPGFTSEISETPQGASIFVRTNVNETKPPLLLLHGFPQTHVEFHKIVPSLLPYFSIILLDLRGYGASSVVSSKNGSGYSKRLMAQDCVFVMSQLGYDKFFIVGHDRGGRVAYRLAFDYPEKLYKVAVIDIIPTLAMYRTFGDTNAGLKAYHWLFLAQPESFPEKMIQAADNGKLFLDHTLSSWTAKNTLEDFNAIALEKYREAYCNEIRIHSTCEDYRAGAFFDKVYDEEELERGRKIETPLLAIWGTKGLFAEAMATKVEGTLQIWQKFARVVSGKALQCGHFVPEEDPEGLVLALLAFLL